jgi:hypothetical protein
MPSARHPNRLPAPWLRVLAVVCAALVFTLSSAAWSPAIHAWLHGHSDIEANAHHDHTACSHAHESAPAPTPASGCGTDGDSAHACAVVLLAGGVTTALACLDLKGNSAQAFAVTITSQDRFAPPCSRHLRPQPHAPPVG